MQANFPNRTRVDDILSVPDLAFVSGTLRSRRDVATVVDPRQERQRGEESAAPDHVPVLSDLALADPKRIHGLQGEVPRSCHALLAMDEYVIRLGQHV